MSSCSVTDTDPFYSQYRDKRKGSKILSYKGNDAGLDQRV